MQTVLAAEQAKPKHKYKQDFQDDWNSIDKGIENFAS
jgi:hypothetical protein